MANNSTKPRKITKEETPVISGDCEENIPKERTNFEDSINHINTRIDDNAFDLATSIEGWITTTLRNIDENLACLIPLEMSGATQKIIEGLSRQNKYLFNKSEDLKNQTHKNSKTLYPTHNIIKVRDVLLPLSAEVVKLYDMITIISKSVFRS